MTPLWIEALPLGVLGSCAMYACWGWGAALLSCDVWKSCAEFKIEQLDYSHGERRRLTETLNSVADDRDLWRSWSRQLVETTDDALIARDAANARATDLEDRLRRIERQRSDTTRKGNETRAARRKALVGATTAKLNREIAARVTEEAA